jgi:hypothetical protein
MLVWSELYRCAASLQDESTEGLRACLAHTAQQRLLIPGTVEIEL